MAHHNSTPQTVLDAPVLTPVMEWVANYIPDAKAGGLRRKVQGTFVGDVERDLLGVTVGTSRKGRKVRR